MKNYRVVYILLFLVFTGLRIVKLGTHSLWIDEGFTWYTATHLNITELIKNRLSAGHFPFYFLLLKLWIKLFGMSELSLRFPSFITGVFSLLIFISLAKGVLTSEKNRLMAFVIFGISPYGIAIAQEARMYGIALLIFLLVIIEFIKILKEETRRYTLYFFWVFLFLLNGSITFMPFLILNLYLMFNFKNPKVKKLLIVNLICFFILSPLFYAVFIHSRFSQIEHFYLGQRFNPGEQSNYIRYWLLEFFCETAGLNAIATSAFNSSLILLILILFPAGLSLSGMRKLKNPERKIFLFLFWLSLIPFVFSYKMEPRYLFYLFPLLAISWANCLASINFKKLFWGTIIIWGVVMGKDIFIYYTVPKSNWKEIAIYLNSHTRKEEAIWLFPKFCSPVFSYYYQGKAKVVKINPADLPTAVKKDVNAIWYLHWMNASLPWVGGKHAMYTDSYIKNLLFRNLKLKDKKIFFSQKGNTEVLYFVQD